MENRSLGFDFDRQRCIDNYIVDFYCKELMLAIEIDGGSHDNEEAFEKDRLRDARLNELGVSVIRFTEANVKYDMPNLLRVLEAEILRIVNVNKDVKLPDNFDRSLLNG